MLLITWYIGPVISIMSLLFFFFFLTTNHTHRWLYSQGGGPPTATVPWPGDARVHGHTWGLHELVLGQDLGSRMTPQSPHRASIQVGGERPGGKKPIPTGNTPGPASSIPRKTNGGQWMSPAKTVICPIRVEVSRTWVRQSCHSHTLVEL